MDDRKYLLDQIKKWKRKMNLAKLIDSGILYAAAGGILGMLCEFISLFRQFYYADFAAVLCFGAGLLAGIFSAVYRRADMKQAAGKLDSFGLKERMLTAYENLGKEDAFSELQRKDAVLHYNKIREQIRIPLLPDRRHVLALLVSIAAVAVMRFIPSPVREQAELRHQVQEEAEKETKELEELIDALEKVDMESLTEAQRAELQELLDAMELSREELSGADTWESLSGAVQRLDYKYGQAAQSLSSLVSQIENPAGAGIAGAEAFARAAAERNGGQTASSGIAAGNAGAGGDGSGGSNGQSGENGTGGENGAGGGSGQNKGNGNGSSSQNSGNGSSGSNGQNGGSGSGGGNGQNGGNGSSGNGGQGGNGQGGGNGGQAGNGSGSGRGTGSSSASHDYVSIPNETADDPALSGNKTGNQDSNYYRQQNGLAWEGDHVDYSSVIGEYTDSAYEGIANGKYPSGMESVIRDYFENLNQ